MFNTFILDHQTNGSIFLDRMCLFGNNYYTFYYFLMSNYKYIFNVEGRNYVIDTKEILHLSQQQLEEINRNGKPQLCHDVVVETKLKSMNIVRYEKTYK